MERACCALPLVQLSLGGFHFPLHLVVEDGHRRDRLYPRSGDEALSTERMTGALFVKMLSMTTGSSSGTSGVRADDHRGDDGGAIIAPADDHDHRRRHAASIAAMVDMPIIDLTESAPAPTIAMPMFRSKPLGACARGCRRTVNERLRLGFPTEVELYSIAIS